MSQAYLSGRDGDNGRWVAGGSVGPGAGVVQRPRRVRAEQLGLKVKKGWKGAPGRDLYCPGPLLNVKLEAGPATGLRLPAEFACRTRGGPRGMRRTEKEMRYEVAPVLASGWLLGEPALLDMPLGQSSSAPDAAAVSGAELAELVV